MSSRLTICVLVCFSDPTLVKRCMDKDSNSVLSAVPTCGPASSVFVIEEHFNQPEALLATEV
jgi:hypothetical protein